MPIEMSDKLDRVQRYLNLIGEPVKLKDFLGSGTDGAVWATDGTPLSRYLIARVGT